MIAEARDWAPLETGGILMGYWSLTRSEVVITHTIGAGPAAIHRRSSFEPDSTYQQKQIDQIYAESGRLYTYLGDWHSHPIPCEQLSRRDKRTLLLIGTDRRARASIPIMGIVTKRQEWTLTLWKARLGRFTRRVPVTRVRVQSFSLRYS